MKKQKNKLWMFLKLLLSITLSLNLIGCMNSAEDKRILNREKTKVQEYLKAKYGEEFVVTYAHYRMPEIGKIRIDTTAYPKDDKSLKFRTTACPKDNYADDPFGSDYKETGYYDTYLDVYWREAAYEELKPIIENIFPKDVRKFEVYAGPSGDSDLDIDNMLGYTPTYEEIKKKYPEEISFSLDVEIVKENIDIQKESEKIMELINKIRNPKLGHYQLTFDYYDDNTRYLCTIWEPDIDVIQSVDDIMKNFKIINK
ncbi:hypothetical protein [Clostridium sp. ZS2-4]|uniref:hypothetical protein n=1 Tax=Clostridium sp. ZS2-4 TaxID=2987703 RepID=UPI00227C304B|nr:hypothetical protein [Clostridium sp. ZS2-4]MCY6355663.1 hypothetical protein [Clostridium sp. ZS2-4]